jgi:beta-lactamase class D
MTLCRFAGLIAFGAMIACSSGPEPRIAAPLPERPAAAESVPAATARRADYRLTELSVAARPELGRAFDEEHIQGGITLFDSATGELFASDVELAKRAFPPASTFKVPHAAIALELGVLESPDSPMLWDGQYSKVEEWNRDHTLRTAMQVSCVPCFQRLARTIGAEREREWVKRLEYGNADTAGKIDTFWLGGALRITPVEQLDFLRRLDLGKLALSGRTLDMVKDVIVLDVGEGHVLYGKTGLSGPPEAEVEVGWFVGFVTLGERSVYFATVVTGHPPDVDIVPVRRRVTETLLRSRGVLPEKPGLR